MVKPADFREKSAQWFRDWPRRYAIEYGRGLAHAIAEDFLSKTRRAKTNNVQHLTLASRLVSELKCHPFDQLRIEDYGEIGVYIVGSSGSGYEKVERAIRVISDQEEDVRRRLSRMVYLAREQLSTFSIERAASRPEA